jgi:ABC-type antimicrobial peptide transport system permease subunit
MLLKNSLKQMGRTKGRVISFLFLMILAVTFLSLGVNLWQSSNKNLEEYEEAFTTIGVVNQKENAVKVTESWDAAVKEYFYLDEAVYDSILPVSLLDFEGANYITLPEKRPYYGAYNHGIKIRPVEEEEDSIRQWGSIIEFIPYEDGIPKTPMKAKITKVLWGKRKVGENVWFCDQFNDNPEPLKAGKTYVTAIISFPCPFSDVKYHSLPYIVPYNAIASKQKNKNGELVKKISISSKNWTEVTDQFYETKEGQALETLTQVYERFIKHSFPVIPTNKTGLLMDFHQGNVSISQGRDITQEEYSRGEKVCIVPQGFAGRNELKVGDKINLQLYFADYNRSASLTYYPSGGINLLFTLLNAKGEAYPVFEDSNYEIVGIYSGTNQNNNPTGYEMGYNAVVIPSESVKNSDENNIADFGPMKGYTTSFQIPNGTTKEYMEKFQALGIDNLEISFYDGGYEKLASGMENLKMVALILVAVSGVTTLAILFFFIYLFITKQKKRTAIERSLGMSKKECILSMLYGILGVISLGAMAGSFLGFKITGVVMADSVGGEELYSTAFSNWVNNSDKMAKLSTSGTWNNPIIPILLSLIVILVAIFISFLFIKNNLRAEPLGLLSKGEE